jgi:hypothetical protein
VIRKGGLTDSDEEEAIRATKPESIVMAARSAVERLSQSHIQILGGRWARKPDGKGKFAPTGNFVYKINGKVDFANIMLYTQALIAPLRVGVLVPSHHWVWAHFRGVPTSGSDGVIYDPDTLTAEVLCNPIFQGVTLCMPAHWQQAISTLMTSNTAMVLVVYVDETGAVTDTLKQKGLHFFGGHFSAAISGSSPRLILSCSVLEVAV